tara:strand:- start:299 stop:481 length:183 start_codon:yes stop_codon:yes gene_type:complete
MRVYKFYEVKYQMNNLYWQSLAYFKKEEDANEYIKSHRPVAEHYPIKVIEHSFTNLKDLK